MPVVNSCNNRLNETVVISALTSPITKVTYAASEIGMDANADAFSVSNCMEGNTNTMARNPILDLPLHNVMRSDIALPLQHVLQLYTVGSLLDAWRSPRQQRSIEQMFESPEQARHAVATCAAWLGVHAAPTTGTVPKWWREERHADA